jgi:hypothetical protein
MMVGKRLAGAFYFRRTACFFDSFRTSPDFGATGEAGSVSFSPLSWTEPDWMNCLRSSPLDFSMPKADWKAKAVRPRTVVSAGRSARLISGSSAAVRSFF